LKSTEKECKRLSKTEILTRGSRNPIKNIIKKNNNNMFRNQKILINKANEEALPHYLPKNMFKHLTTMEMQSK
jgi:hypothetical protein